MPIPTYTLGYPPDGSSLGQTKSTIRNNLDGTFETLNVDHVNNNGQPGSNPAGYHTIIHEVTQTNVTTISGVNQIFSGVPGTLIVNGVTTKNVPSNGDTQLYSLTGMGGLSQLTGNNASANGYCWMGGILIQWGTGPVAAKPTISSFSFPVQFPNACFSVTFGTRYANLDPSPSSNPVFFYGSTPTFTTSGFSMVNSSSNTPVSIYWIAIGN